MRAWMGRVALTAIAALIGHIAMAQQHQHRGGGAHATVSDTRVAVPLPPSLATHMLANMRDHLLALQEINDALARADYDSAARIAEVRLGMTSLRQHGAHEVAPHMPQAMQEAGTAMHRAASRFAIAAQNAGVTGDVKQALGALGDVMRTCVGCHAGFRLQ